METSKSILLLISLLTIEIKSQYPDYVGYYGFPYGVPFGGGQIPIPQGQVFGIAGVDPITGAITGAIAGGLMGILSGGRKR